MKNTVTIEEFTVEVERKRIKHLHLTVRPPHGIVRISAPYHVAEETIQNFVRSKITWVRKHRSRIMTQRWDPPLRYLTGETHLLFGNKYTLRVFAAEGKSSVRLNSQTIDLYLSPRSGMKKRKQIVEGWYREQLRKVVPTIIVRYEQRMQVTVAEWRMKIMKTKWGTCNISSRRIWLNPELAKKPLNCVEHVVVHEMVHLLERRHNARFKELMTLFYPDWVKSTAALNGKGVDNS